MDLETSGNVLRWIGYLILGGFVLLPVLCFLGALRLHLRTLRAGFPLPMITVFVLHLRRARASKLIDAFLLCRKAGVTVEMDELELLHRSSPRDFVANVQQLIASKTSGSSAAGLQAAKVNDPSSR